MSETYTNPSEYTSAGPFSLGTTNQYEILRDVNWAFGSIGFGPRKVKFESSIVRFFYPLSTTDSSVVKTSDIKDLVEETTDIEVFIRLQQPFREHDMISIDFPSVFDLTDISSIWSHGGGYAPYKDHYISSNEETWSKVLYYGRHLR